MKKRIIRLKQTKQVRSYNESLRKGAKTRHIVKRNNGWAIKKVGKKRASEIFSHQSKAIKAAKRDAKKDKTNVVIHKSDGRIRNVIRY